jgi:hypothetical protein
MIYKGKIIKAGDVLYTDSGAPFTISDWSVGSGDIYGRTENGTYCNIKDFKGGELYWNFPFISRHQAAAPRSCKTSINWPKITPIFALRQCVANGGTWRGDYVYLMEDEAPVVRRADGENMFAVSGQPFEPVTAKHVWVAVRENEVQSCP